MAANGVDVLLPTSVAPAKNFTWLIEPSTSLAVAVRPMLAGAVKLAPSTGLVSDTDGTALLEPGASKNKALLTAFGPPVRVTRIRTRPVTAHVKYWPPLKAVAARESSTSPLEASTSWMVSLRPCPSQSTR